MHTLLQICDYLFELSQKFNQFYEHCPVLKADNEETRRDRAALCTLTSGTLLIFNMVLALPACYEQKP
jgi:arginyl-tRNA synthetase